jgi:hypothetical protein
LISKLKDGFNDGNVLSMLTQLKPMNAFYFFLLFLVGMFLMKPKQANQITAQ